jgi:hypothetical protein
VGASGADGEEFGAAARQDHVLITHLTLNHSSLWNSVDSYTACEIRYNTAHHMSVLGNDHATSHAPPKFALA